MCPFRTRRPPRTTREKQPDARSSRGNKLHEANNATRSIELGAKDEHSRLKLDGSHFERFEQWEWRDEVLLQEEILRAIKHDGVERRPAWWRCCC